VLSKQQPRSIRSLLPSTAPRGSTSSTICSRGDVLSTQDFCEPVVTCHGRRCVTSHIFLVLCVNVIRTEMAMSTSCSCCSNSNTASLSFLCSTCSCCSHDISIGSKWNELFSRCAVNNRYSRPVFRHTPNISAISIQQNKPLVPDTTIWVETDGCRSSKTNTAYIH
jgi:hypothetical protein